MQNLIKSLGKKEGELEGFQDQLRKAMDALNKSEEAVEVSCTHADLLSWPFLSTWCDKLIDLVFQINQYTLNKSVNNATYFIASHIFQFRFDARLLIDIFYFL